MNSDHFHELYNCMARCAFAIDCFCSAIKLIWCSNENRARCSNRSISRCKMYATIRLCLPPKCSQFYPFLSNKVAIVYCAEGKKEMFCKCFYQQKIIKSFMWHSQGASKGKYVFVNNMVWYGMVRCTFECSARLLFCHQLCKPMAAISSKPFFIDDLSEGLFYYFLYHRLSTWGATTDFLLFFSLSLVPVSPFHAIFQFTFQFKLNQFIKCF